MPFICENAVRGAKLDENNRERPDRWTLGANPLRNRQRAGIQENKDSHRIRASRCKYTAARHSKEPRRTSLLFRLSSLRGPTPALRIGDSLARIGAQNPLLSPLSYRAGFGRAELAGDLTRGGKQRANLCEPRDLRIDLCNDRIHSHRGSITHASGFCPLSLRFLLLIRARCGKGSIRFSDFLPRYDGSAATSSGNPDLLENRMNIGGEEHHKESPAQNEQNSNG